MIPFSLVETEPETGDGGTTEGVPKEASAKGGEHVQIRSGSEIGGIGVRALERNIFWDAWTNVSICCTRNISIYVCCIHGCHGIFCRLRKRIRSSLRELISRV
jgi:hypothetical protein